MQTGTGPYSTPYYTTNFNPVYGMVTNTNTYTYGEFPDGQDKFIGIKFDISGGTHYGWVRVNLNTNADQITIKDWAYETTPDEPIFTGDDGTIILSPTADTLYVSEAGSGSMDGSSWANALAGSTFTNNINHLNYAMNKCPDATEIWVAKGTYKTSDIGNRDISFTIKNSLKVYGGFAGTETAIEQRTDFGLGGTNETILSGDLSGDDNSNINTNEATRSDNSKHVVIFEDVDNTTHLDGFVITGGNANDASNDGNIGGGIFILTQEQSYCEPVISNCVIHTNTSQNGGGVGTKVNFSGG